MNILGGSIGILTEKLARRCQSLLSVDVSQIAQTQAIDRCRHLNNIEFELMSVSQSFPTASFDLIVLSEVGYYWSWEDLHQAQDLILDRLQFQGHLLLVHWIADSGILACSFYHPRQGKGSCSFYPYKCRSILTVPSLARKLSAWTKSAVLPIE